MASTCVGSSRHVLWLLFLLLSAFCVVYTEASYGDRLPEFRECVRFCMQKNCRAGQETPIPLHRRLLFWDCASECDYSCQHIITQRRVEAGLPIVQFHGKWPFYRFLGIQEPFSMIFSLGNLWAHWYGLKSLRAEIPASYPLRHFYEKISYVGHATWILSAVFHTRDFPLTEQLDYFAAGLSVLYGLYYTVVRIFRLDKPEPRRRSVLHAWTTLCALMYIAHVTYLKLGSWDYTYNMTANVVVGMTQNLMWIWFSIRAWRRTGQFWQTWPGLMVVWLITALSLELFDFAPVGLNIDAHSLWHAATIFPTLVWYRFLIKDAQADIASQRLKE